MKKFLVFCVAIIVTVSLGFMVYYFTLNNEGVTVPETVYRLNVGDTVSFEITHINPKKDTKISFAYEKEGIVEFDAENQSIKALAEGSTKVTLQTSNKDIPTTTIDVYVGGGSKENPFFIKKQDDLVRIGKVEDVFKLSSNYKLINDIALNLENWEPIGGNGASAPTESFSGTFNGDGHTISNIKVNTSLYAGLFAKIGATGVVSHLNLSNVTISGACDYAGAIAGMNCGTIRNCAVASQSSITSANSNAKVGGIAGENRSETSIANIYKCSSNATVSGSGSIGGIAGANNGAEVAYCYTDLDTTINGTGVAGGIVGTNGYGASYASVVAGCYVLGKVEGSTANKVGAVVGFNEYNESISINEKTNKIYGNYYVSTAFAKGIGNYADEENASSDPAGIDYGVYGVEGKTYDDLTKTDTFKLLRNATTDDVIAWDFSNVWIMPNQGTPKLNVEGAYVGNKRSELIEAGQINTADKLRNIKSGDVVEISQDIDLGGIEWTPLDVVNVTLQGSEEFKQANGRYPKIYNFKLVNGEKVGFFKSLDNSIIKNINFEQVSNVNNVFNASEVAMGILAGEIKENAEVENVGLSYESLSININDKLNGKNIYIGSVAGQNYGTIKNVRVNGGNVKITCDAEVVATTYVGGIAGALLGNNNAVESCEVSAFKVDNANINDGAVGGVVGLMTNSTRVENCYVASSSISSAMIYGKKSNDNLIGHYEGAIVGQADMGAKESVIKNSTANKVSVTGFVVGGVIGSTTGVVESCYVNGDLTGFKVGGVAGYQINSSKINNVRVDGELKNTDVSFGLGQVHSSKAQKAGVACISYGNQNEIPKFSNVFVNCKFNADGKDSYKTTATIKDNSFMNRLGVKWIFSGEESNIVVNKDKAGNAKTNEKADSFINAIGNFIAPTTFSIYETNEGTINKGDFDVFTSHGYSIDNWTFISGYAPLVKNAVNAEVQKA